MAGSGIGSAMHAWRTGAPVVGLANVVEYDEEWFGPSPPEESSRSWLDDSRAYESLATLFAPSIQEVISERPRDRAWLEVEADVLGRAAPRMTVSPPLGGLGVSRRSLPIVGAAVEPRGPGPPILPWGLTLGASELLDATSGPPPSGASSREVLEVARTFESKVTVNGLFGGLVDGISEARLPAQAVAEDLASAADLVGALVHDAGAVYLKSEFGLGGFGAARVTPDDLRARTPYQLVRGLVEADARFGAGRLVVEPDVAFGVARTDASWACIIGDGGELHHVGLAIMTLEETRCVGTVVGPDLLDAPVEASVRRLGDSVAGALATEGYRGWMGLDVVVTETSSVWPLEVNLRLTGATIPHAVRAQLAAARDVDHHVGSFERVVLPRRTSEEQMFDVLETARGLLRPEGIDLFGSIVSEVSRPREPYVGVVVAGPRRDDLGRGLHVLRRAAARALGPGRGGSPLGPARRR